MSEDFLPKDYEMPVAPSNYMKFEEGANKLRILSSAIIGWEWWVEDDKGGRKPNRVKKEGDVPVEFFETQDSRKKAKHFWAFVIYNYKLKMIQILEVTQKGVMKGIRALVENEDWGDPKTYDITISKIKTGAEDRDVEYSVMPSPKKEMDAGIVKFYEDRGIDLTVLYEGGDPFGDPEEKEAEKLADEVDKATS